MELTKNSLQVFDYLKENGDTSIDELAAALREGNKRSMSASVTDLTKKGLAVREKNTIEGEEGDKTVITIVKLVDPDAVVTLKTPKAKAKAKAKAKKA